jgi:hypothetical protein
VANDALDHVLGDANPPKAASGTLDLTRDDCQLPVRLLGLEGLCNVNALADGQHLALAENGLTINYGDNGAGKSGYTRVIKHDARSARREPVLGNVGSDLASSPPPRARVRLRRGEVERTIELDLSGEPPGELASVSVFDHWCSSRYVDGDSEIDYIPTVLTGLRKLAEAQTQVQRCAEERIAKLARRQFDLSPYPAGTAVRDRLANPESPVSAAEVRALATFTEEETVRRTDLRAAVGEIDARHTGRLRIEVERQVRLVERLSEELMSLQAHVDRRALTTAREAFSTVEALREAVDHQSAAAFADQPLAGAGSNSHRALMEAAKAFVLASSGHIFPQDELPNECPLCMQELSTDARERLRSFDAFVQQDLQARLQGAEATARSLIEELPAIATVTDRHLAALELIGESPGQLGAQVREWLAGAGRTFSVVRKGRSDEIPEAHSGPPPTLEPWMAAKRQEAARHAALEDVAEQHRIRTELADLDARGALAEHLDDVLAVIANRDQEGRLKAAVKELDTRGVSRKLSELTRAFVSEDVRRALHSHLRKLGFPDAELIVPGTRTLRGQPRIRLHLNNASDVAVGSVLSGGEQRRLALAMYLAEATVSDMQGPLVLDDPISSVDHNGRRHVARTLVELARERQVVVFTHDLVFIQRLQTYARHRDVPCLTQHIRRLDGRPGFVEEGLPWQGKTAKQRLGVLRDRLPRLRRLVADQKEDEYGQSARRFCGDLRDSFERAVEDELLGGAVVRRDPGVHLQQLKDVAWSEEAVRLATRGLDETSPWVHDVARADNEPPPTTDELQEGLDLLAALLSEVKSIKTARCEQVGKIEVRRLPSPPSVASPNIS